jgi:hypothetical protein
MRDEFRQRLWTEIGRLRASHREAVVMRCVEGCSYEEIAEALHLSVNTARLRVNRGIKQLRQRLGAGPDWREADTRLLLFIPCPSPPPFSPGAATARALAARPTPGRRFLRKAQGTMTGHGIVLKWAIGLAALAGLGGMTAYRGARNGASPSGKTVLAAAAERAGYDAFPYYRQADGAYQSGQNDAAVRAVKKGLSGRLRLDADVRNQFGMFAVLRSVARENRKYALSLKGQPARAGAACDLDAALAEQIRTDLQGSGLAARVADAIGKSASGCRDATGG